MRSSGKGLEGVIADLAAIVSEARINQSEIGIFPAMYRSVTIAIHEGIDQGQFDDPDRIEHLAIVFANRYLDAHQDWRNGRPPTEAWRVTFNAATDGVKR